jgi:hypothetical protein
VNGNVPAAAPSRGHRCAGRKSAVSIAAIALVIARAVNILA